MKKLVLSIAAIALASFGSFAQKVGDGKTPVSDSQVITLTANLKTTLALQLDTKGITFDFVSLGDYKNGLGSDGSYTSKGAVSSTSNWNLSAKAVSDFKHSDGTTIMPLNNVGLSVAYTGTKPIKNNTAAAPLALANTERILIGHNGTNPNAGDFSDNGFTVKWEMGTKRGDMNGTSLFDQDLKKGTYTTQVQFIATEVMK
ncbi:MAG: hypothetical protein Q8909_20430 [Bacteroidota bacterium]|nr:hypothetical protein [Bacteroidota bacterium]